MIVPLRRRLHSARTFAAAPQASEAPSVVVRDDKILRETYVRRGLFLLHVADTREARAALELQTQFRQLFGRPAGEDLDATVAQIAHVPAHVQLGRGVLREIAKPHTLHGAGDEVPLGLLRSIHGT